ncbi:MAG: hypothetical protein JWN45_2617 [Acidobacteriaceae bacterium]|nr:hypothetical protein [Acidobacteriaceae bacterium]
MKPLLRILVLLLLWVMSAAAQTATVTRNVNLRPDPSTDNQPLKKLAPGIQIQLLEPDATNGFLHVKADDQTGWVWSKSVKIQETLSTPPSAASSGIVDATSASAISSSWDKPAPQDGIFHSAEGDCGETGDGGDTETNRRKNRTDVPAEYHPVTWDAINTQKYPQGAPKSRTNWTPNQLAQTAPFEGAAVSVEGYLYKVKVESSSPSAKRGGESTNCHARLANDVDWHMPLTANVDEGEDVAIIVETTPRVRQAHTNWTTARLKPWTAHVGSQPNSNYNRQKVRISGWLMLDPEHQDMINSRLRSTLWEIHPITKIEVWNNGQWVDSDNQP